MDLHIRVPVMPQLVSDILETAVAGGIDYWLSRITVARNKQLDQIENILVKPDERDSDFKLIDHPTAVYAIQRLLEGEVEVSETIKQSIYQAVVENDASYIDADGADVIVQVAAFGEIVYG